MENKQLSLADAVVGLGRRSKVSKAVRTLGEIDKLVHFNFASYMFKSNRTGRSIKGRSRIKVGCYLRVLVSPAHQKVIY